MMVGGSNRPAQAPVAAQDSAEESTGLVAQLGIVQLAVGLLGLVASVVILLSLMWAGFSDLDLRAFTTQYVIQFLPAVGLAYLLTMIGYGVRDLEPWSFPWVLYGNLLMIAFYFYVGGAVTILVISNVCALLLLFTPGVRKYWWSIFVEDMKPRLKETRYSLYLIRKSPIVVVGTIIIVFYIALAFLAPFIVHYGTSPYFIPRHYDDTLLPPSSEYWFGTDYLGSDIYSSIIWGAQLDLRIAFSVVAVGLIAGALLGAVSGYYGGWVDEAMMRITDVFFAFPGLILAMAVVAALGGRSLENVSIALMIVWWPTYARLVRGQVLIEREKLYVEASRSVGASDARILVFHVLPNTIQPVIVQATLDIGAVILTAAGLSFIGYGAEPGTAEWGLMISEGQRNFECWWVTFFPGIAILFCALAFNLVGDGVRDIMDPKLRRRT